MIHFSPGAILYPMWHSTLTEINLHEPHIVTFTVFHFVPRTTGKYDLTLEQSSEDSVTVRWTILSQSHFSIHQYLLAICSIMKMASQRKKKNMSLFTCDPCPNTVSILQEEALEFINNETEKTPGF